MIRTVHLRHSQRALTEDVIFTYMAVDDHGFHSNVATVTIRVTGVNDNAVIGGTDSGSVTEDAALTATGTLTVSDVDSGQSVFNAGILAGAHGSLVIDAVGAWTYTLDNGDAAVQALAAASTLTDTVTVSSVDGTTHDVTITVTGVNDVPEATVDAYSTGENAVLNVDAPGVLANDTDPDATDVLTVQFVNTDATIGAVTWTADGSFTYDPGTHFDYLAVGQTATDSFSYTASDGHGGTSGATVTITINGANDAPVAADHSDTTSEDSVLSGSDLLTAATDVDNGAVVGTVPESLTSGLGAAVTINADGTYTYDPTGSATLQALAASRWRRRHLHVSGYRRAWRCRHSHNEYIRKRC